jgi:hypothetical protein
MALAQLMVCTIACSEMPQGLKSQKAPDYGYYQSSAIFVSGSDLESSLLFFFTKSAYPVWIHYKGVVRIITETARIARLTTWVVVVIHQRPWMLPHKSAK